MISTTGSSGISGYAKAKVRLDNAMLAFARADAEAGGLDPESVTIKAWRLHDLRRTAASRMAQLGTNPHIIEAVLKPSIRHNQWRCGNL